jgi:gamma-glutamyltranspeptidase
MKDANHQGVRPSRRPRTENTEPTPPVTRKRPQRAPRVTVHTGRPATPAPSGLVTSPHALASSAGIDVLRAGGSAVDGAIATSAALAVLYPHMTGIGGDAF